MRETFHRQWPTMAHMSKIETAIALPIRQIVTPLQLALGSAITLSGVALLCMGPLPGA